MRLASTLAFCAIALLLISHRSSADTALRVDESATRAVIKDTNAELSLAIDNPYSDDVNARIKIELLSPQDKARISTEKDAEIKPGSSRFNCELAIDQVWQMTACSYQERIWHQKSAPSMMHDYYNPEARAIVPPVKFTVDKDVQQMIAAHVLEVLLPRAIMFWLSAPESPESVLCHRVLQRSAHE